MRLNLLKISLISIIIVVFPLYKEKIANTFVSAIVNSNGLPERIRTFDTRLRRPLLYPAELLGDVNYYDQYHNSNNILPQSIKFCNLFFKLLYIFFQTIKTIYNNISFLFNFFMSMRHNKTIRE